VFRNSIPEDKNTPGISKTMEVELPAGIYLVKIGEGLNLITSKLMIK
jgi:hypothetical protein